MEHCKYNSCVNCYPKRVAVDFCLSCGFHPEEQKRRKEYAQSRAQAIERDRKHSVLSIRIRRQKNGKNRYSTLAVKKRTRRAETDTVYKKSTDSPETDSQSINQQPVQKSTVSPETDTLSRNGHSVQKPTSSSETDIRSRNQQTVEKPTECRIGK